MIAADAVAVIASFAVAVALTALLVRIAPRLGLLDTPNDRSSHALPTPRGGGIAVVVAAAAGMIVFSVAGRPPSKALGVILVAIASLAVVGLADDRFHLSARVRFGAQVVAAIAVVIAIGPVSRIPLPHPLDVPLGWLAWPLTMLWLVGVTNFFNFMDGIDGLATSQTAASCVGVVIAGWSTYAQQLAAVVLAAALGFLIFNRPQAKIFLGDAGSTSIGFALAALPLLAPEHTRPAAVLALGIGLSLFLLDPVETLIRLARLGRPIGSAHRMHSYQRLTIETTNPGAVTASLATAGLVLSIVAGLCYRLGWSFWPVMILAAAIFATERLLPDHPTLLQRAIRSEARTAR